MSGCHEYLISIIIPVYNVDKYIERAMQSLLDQTIGFENLQVIFVDDCSTDDSWNIVCVFKEKYENVLAYHLSKNSGSPGVPRNKGLELAKADYIMFLDPDDFYYKNTCEVLYKEIHDSEFDFVSGFHNRTELSDEIDIGHCETKKNISLKSGIYDATKDTEEVIDGRGALWEKIYKVSVIRDKKILFCENIPGEDTYFLCHYILESKKVKYLSSVVYCYVLRETSITFNVSKDFLCNISKCYRSCYDLFIKYNKVNSFKVLIKWVIDDYFNILFETEINNSDVMDVLKAYYWLCDYYYKNNLLVRSEYNKILLRTVLLSNSNLVLFVYQNLRTIRKYTIKLESVEKWFLEQIACKNEEIENLSLSNIELKNWTSELQESKEWLTQQINNKDKEIKNLNESASKLKDWIKELESSKEWFIEQISNRDIELKNISCELEESKKWFTEQLDNKDTELKNVKEELDNKNKKLLDIKNYYKQPFYKRLFSRKPNIDDKD